jgi:hypothetical protein
LIDNVKDSSRIEIEESTVVEQNSKKKAPIKSISLKDTSSRSEVQEPA